MSKLLPVKQEQTVARVGNFSERQALRTHSSFFVGSCLVRHSEPLDAVEPSNNRRSSRALLPDPPRR